MRRNVASQNVAAQMNSRTDGSPLTSAVTVLITKDGGAQSASGGTLTHKGNGHWNYAPTQAETDAVHVAFTFTHATGVNQTVQTYPVSFNPGDAVGLGLSRLDAAITTRATPAQVATELATYDGPTFTELDARTDALDAAVAAVQADTDNIQTRIPAALVGGRIAANAEVVGADAVNAAALATDAVNEIRDAVFARAFSAAYSSYTFDELVKMIAAVLLAKCSGMGTVTGTFRNLADSGNVVVATVDADGNRSAVTRTP